MSDDIPPPSSYAYEMIDEPLEPRSSVTEVSDAVKGASQTIRDTIEIGKKPGMPLSVLSNIAREAPLGSLLIAFLLGVAVARRRWGIPTPANQARNQPGLMILARAA